MEALLNTKRVCLRQRKSCLEYWYKIRHHYNKI